MFTYYKYICLTFHFLCSKFFSNIFNSFLLYFLYCLSAFGTQCYLPFRCTTEWFGIQSNNSTLGYWPQEKGNTNSIILFLTGCSFFKIWNLTENKQQAPNIGSWSDTDSWAQCGQKLANAHPSATLFSCGTWARHLTEHQHQTRTLWNHDISLCHYRQKQGTVQPTT